MVADREEDDVSSRHLSQISTAWTDVIAAQGGSEAGAAQWRLLERYGRAINRYLLASLKDPEAAEETYQEFALRLVRGDFRNADPRRGRFRDFLKTTLYHLIVDHRRRGRRRLLGLTDDAPDPEVDSSPSAEEEERFQAVWKAELMSRAWESLAEFERATNQPVYSVLRMRADHPELKAAQMASLLSETLGRAVTSEWVHKRLFLARRKFTGFLVEEVAQSLACADHEKIEEELIDLGLLEYCRSALERSGG